MSICAFFGHRDTPMVGAIETHLREVIRDLILYHDVDEFWLGEQGTFDSLSLIVMRGLKQEFKWVAICILPAYYPSNAKLDWMYEQGYEFIYPEVVAKALPRIAILRRNEYMTQHADYIVCYIKHKSGGAFKAVEQARKNGKKIINLAEYI